MSSMSMMAPAMMVAMMLPAIAPSIWRHHRHLCALRVRHAAQHTTLFAVGYACVWTAIGFALFAMSSELFPMETVSPTDSPLKPLMLGGVILCAGALQISRWKTKQLLRCRQACVMAAISKNVFTAWCDGCRLGVDCALSCAAPMAVLFVTGLTDARMMVVITAAITAERVLRAGARIARLTGALALLVGLVICARAIAPTCGPPVATSSC